MTRFLEKDKGTQVNSNLIGVQVKPATSPITYNVKGVVVNNYRLDYVSGYGFVQLDGQGNPSPAMSGNNCFSANDGNVYYWNGGSTYEGEYTETTLWHYSMWGGDGSTVYYVSWNTQPQESDFDRWKDYICVWDGEGKPNFSDAPTGVHCFINSGDSLILNSTNGNIEGYYGNTDYMSEDFLCDEFGNAYAFNGGTYSYQGQAELYFNGNEGSTGGNTYNEMEGTFEGVTVYGYTMGGYDFVPEDEVVKVGDTVYQTLDDLTFGVYSVASLIDVSTGGGETDPVDCTLSYSVDGETWTEWSENMTDENNVISNIPRYMYLKFSQDVVITEE